MPDEPRTDGIAQSNRTSILATLSSRTRAIALVAIIAEALFLVGALSLPEAQRIYAFGICAFLLVLAMAACVWLEGKEASTPVASDQPLVLPAQMKHQVLLIDEATKTAGGQVADLYRTGLNLKFAGRFEDAIKYFQRTLQLSPEHTKARYNIGSCLLYLEKFDDAESHFRALAAALEARSGLLDMIHVEMLHGSYIQLNQIFSKRGRFADGIPFLVESFRVKPDDPLGFLNLAIAALKTGNSGEARKWHQLLFGHPEHANVLTTLPDADRVLIESLSAKQGV